MPDLISHIGSGYLIGARFKKRGWMTLFLLGVILPDLTTRPLYILFESLYWYVKPLHTPVGLVLSCWLISALFIEQQRWYVFKALLAGSSVHLFFDLFQRHMHGGYALFFPFSWATWEFGLFWPETGLLLIPAWLLVIACVIIWRTRKSPTNI